MFRNLFFSFSFFTDVMKNELENLIDSSRKFWQKRSVIKEKHSTLFRDSKEDMVVFNIENLFLKVLSPYHRILVTTRRTEFRLTSNGEQVCNRAVRTFELEKAFWNIPASKKLINGKLDIFKVAIALRNLVKYYCYWKYISIICVINTLYKKSAEFQNSAFFYFVNISDSRPWQILILFILILHVKDVWQWHMTHLKFF